MSIVLSIISFGYYFIEYFYLLLSSYFPAFHCQSQITLTSFESFCESRNKIEKVFAFIFFLETLSVPNNFYVVSSLSFELFSLIHLNFRRSKINFKRICDEKEKIFDNLETFYVQKIVRLHTIATIITSDISR